MKIKIGSACLGAALMLSSIVHADPLLDVEAEISQLDLTDAQITQVVNSNTLFAKKLRRYTIGREFSISLGMERLIEPQ